MSVFAFQAAFSGAGLLFVFFMLWRGDSPSVYLPVATGIVSSWLPSPVRLKKESDVSFPPLADSV